MRIKTHLLLSLLAALFSLNAYADQEKLIFAVDLIRHGDRTAIADLPAVSYIWPQGFGQLTPRGMQQEFELGVKMRKRYITDSHLLPEHYFPQTMYVRSSDFDRTLMSAESLLLGLYPLSSGPALPNSDTAALPSAFQPIPIHTVPLDQDKLLVPDYSPKAYLSLIRKYAFQRADWKQKTAELKPQFARWSQLTGVKISNLLDLVALGDRLYIRQLYKQPLPAGMTEDEVDTIIKEHNWAFATIYKTPEVANASSGRKILKKVADYFQSAAQQKSALKFVLLSAHDSSILSAMSSLRAPMDNPPRYASDLSFNLFEGVGGEYIVKVFLNGEPVVIPTCGGTTCKLNQFKTLSAMNSH